MQVKAIPEPLRKAFRLECLRAETTMTAVFVGFMQQVVEGSIRLTDDQLELGSKAKRKRGAA